VKHQIKFRVSWVHFHIGPELQKTNLDKERKGFVNWVKESGLSIYNYMQSQRCWKLLCSVSCYMHVKVKVATIILLQILCMYLCLTVKHRYLQRICSNMIVALGLIREKMLQKGPQDKLNLRSYNQKVIQQEKRNRVDYRNSSKGNYNVWKFGHNRMTDDGKLYKDINLRQDEWQQQARPATPGSINDIVEWCGRDIQELSAIQRWIVYEWQQIVKKASDVNGRWINDWWWWWRPFITHCHHRVFVINVSNIRSLARPCSIWLSYCDAVWFLRRKRSGVHRPINQSINQSNFLTWPKQRPATSRTTKGKHFAVCTAKGWNRDRTDEISAF